MNWKAFSTNSVESDSICMADSPKQRPENQGDTLIWSYVRQIQPLRIKGYVKGGVRPEHPPQWRSLLPACVVAQSLSNSLLIDDKPSFSDCCLDLVEHRCVKRRGLVDPGCVRQVIDSA
jgi:hypothetical protein